MEKFRVLTIPNDPLEAYDRKGYSHEERHSYFNPNHEFDVTLLGVEETNQEEFTYAGFRVIPSDRSLSNINKIVREVKPHLIKGENGNWASELSAKIGRTHNIPSLTTVHDRFPSEEVGLVDKIICVSDEVKRRCIEKGARDGNCVIIDNGTDLQVFNDYRGSKRVDELLNMYSGNPRILSVGRLTWEKNLENLFMASKKAKEFFPDLTHIHIGRYGELREQLDKIVKDWDIHHLHFLPNQKQVDLPFFYSWADAFTMASLSEGFGIVYIEALSCETPVLTSNRLPMSLIVQDSYNGVLVDPESSQSICDGFYKLFSNKVFYLSLKSVARESVKKYDINLSKKKEAELYKSLIKQHEKK